jgi:protein phosphatase
VASADALGTRPDADEITARFERHELVLGWRRASGASPTTVPVTRVGLKTDLGCLRENNEDKAEFYEPDDPATLADRGSLYLVADGMGGHAAGQIASELAIKRTLTGYYSSHGDDEAEALVAAFRTANEHVFQVASGIPGRSGMGTTLTALALVQDRAVVAHIGDSRAYLVRRAGGRQGDTPDAHADQITEDHSWVAEQVRLGALTLEEAERSPYRNIITRCIGTQPEIEMDVFAVSTRPDDTWVLCSDGLTGHVTDAEIAEIVFGQAPGEACRQLVELACARGGSDNVTVLTVRVLGLRPFEA